MHTCSHVTRVCSSPLPLLPAGLADLSEGGKSLGYFSFPPPPHSRGGESASAPQKYLSCLFEIPFPLFFIPHQGRRRSRNFSSLKHHPPPTPFLPPPSSSSVATVINRGGRWREGDEFFVLPQTPDEFLRRGFDKFLLGLQNLI